MAQTITWLICALMLWIAMYFLYMNAISEENFRVSCMNSGWTAMYIKSEWMHCFSNNIFIK